MKPLARLGKGLDDRALKIDGVSPMKMGERQCTVGSALCASV
jgi:hypothetical protein